MSENKLSLRATPGTWRMFAARKTDKAFIAFAEKVYRRDNYTCRFCGFQAKEYQEIINVNNNYNQNNLANLATACCFCTQCLFIESVGIGDYGGGTLIYLPEISQSNLNSFCHVLFCAITNDTGYKASAQAIYRSLKFRSQMVEDKFGEGTSNPAIFGHLLIDSDAVTEDTTKAIFENMRLLPSRSKFRKQIEKWAATALDELSTDVT